jgi:hypothetical protein
MSSTMHVSGVSGVSMQLPDQGTDPVIVSCIPARLSPCCPVSLADPLAQPAEDIGPGEPVCRPSLVQEYS